MTATLAVRERTTRAGCPTTMVFGPCGGGRQDGRYEVAEHHCPFLGHPAPDLGAVVATPPAIAGGLLDRMAAGPVALAGVDGVLCVTGDGRGPGVRHDVTQVVDREGPRLTSLAAAAGLSAALPESPDPPPVDARAARVALKQAVLSAPDLVDAGIQAEVARRIGEVTP